MLDGLRGLAIVLVFLNHIDSRYIVSALPTFLQPLCRFMFSSGTLGVAFFFVLSGFLMAYLYAEPLPMEFIEKRYARIFPPFLTMVFCMSVFSLIPTLSLFLRIATILFAALVTRTIWTHVVQRFRLGGLFIRLFLGLQFLVAFWYGFVIVRKPAAWFSSLPFALRTGTISAVNGTLTLPFGDYIPMLDGVYWSLVPEVLFYLIYPFLIAPNAKKIAAKSKAFIIIFLVSLIPFFFGTALLMKHVRGFGMLLIDFFIYFFSGITVAYFVKKNVTIPLPDKVKKMFSPLLFFILLFICFLTLGSSSHVTLLYRILWSIPFGLIVWGIMDTDTPLSKFFSSPILVFLGTISYSMYISHTAIVDGMHLLFRPTNMITNILFLLLTATVFLGVSYALHLIVETLYFQYKTPKSTGAHLSFQNVKIANLIFILFFIFLILSAYTSNFNFFSAEKKYSKDNVVFQTNPGKKPLPLSEKPLQFSFVSKEDNLGIVTLHLTNVVGGKEKRMVPIDPNKNQKFLIRIKEAGNEKWYASQETTPAQIGESTSYPFGFPVIADSKNKTYTLELSIKDIDYSSQLVLHTDPFVIQTVHQLNKKELITHPLLLASHTSQKIISVFNNNEARFVVLCTSPLFFLALFLLF